MRLFSENEFLDTSTIGEAILTLFWCQHILRQVSFFRNFREKPLFAENDSQVRLF